MKGMSWSQTDPGLVREANEDTIWADDQLGVYIVADGLGGQAAGDLASRLAVEAVQQAAQEIHQLIRVADKRGDEESRRAVFDKLQLAVEQANRNIFEQARIEPELRGMMTTLTMVALAQQAAFVAHVGDSRAYLFRDGGLEQLTVDHTLAEELIRVGRLQREDVSTFRFRNVVARALGEKATVRVDLLYVDLRDGDRLLLCSDGLSDFVRDDQIVHHLVAKNPAQKQVELANDHGGGDNISVVVIETRSLPKDQTITTPQGPPMEHTAKVDLLRQLYFCQHLTDDERLKVLRYVHEVAVEKGESVVAEGERSDDFYVMVGGSAVVSIDGVRVNIIHDGEHFGEIALVSGQARSATVTALESSHMFRMSRAGFYDLSQKDQAIAVKMLWAISQSLAQRVTELSAELVLNAKSR